MARGLFKIRTNDSVSGVHNIGKAKRPLLDARIYAISRKSSFCVLLYMHNPPPELAPPQRFSPITRCARDPVIIFFFSGDSAHAHARDFCRYPGKKKNCRVSGVWFFSTTRAIEWLFFFFFVFFSYFSRPHRPPLFIASPDWLLLSGASPSDTPLLAFLLLNALSLNQGRRMRFRSVNIFDASSCFFFCYLEPLELRDFLGFFTIRFGPIRGFYLENGTGTRIERYYGFGGTQCWKVAWMHLRRWKGLKAWRQSLSLEMIDAMAKKSDLYARRFSTNFLGEIW